MKTKLLLIIAVLLLCSTISAKAQVVIPDTLKEGRLVYLKDDSRIWKLGTEKLSGKSYIESYPQVNTKLFKTKLLLLYQTVFSRERVKELQGINMSCNIYFDTIENKIIRITYSWNGKEKFPLKLSELEILDKKLRTEPNFIPRISKPDTNEKILDKPLTIWLPLRFSEIYNQ